MFAAAVTALLLSETADPAEVAGAVDDLIRVIADQRSTVLEIVS